MEKDNMHDIKRIIPIIISEREDIIFPMLCKGIARIWLSGPAPENSFIVLNAFASDKRLFIEIRDKNWNKVWSGEV